MSDPVTYNASEPIFLEVEPIYGLYDEIDYQWEIVSGGGEFYPNDLDPKWGLWYIPGDPGQVTIRVNIELRGTGEYAAAGAVETLVQEFSFTLRSELVAPTITLTEDIASLAENDCAGFLATVSGGDYTDIELDWEVVSGGGCLVEYFSKDQIVAPDLTLTDINRLTEEQTAPFTLTVSGGLFDSIEYEWEVVSGGGCLVEYIEAPTLTITDLATLPEDTPGTLIVTPSGGLYDVIEYELEVVAGGGCLVESFAVAPGLAITDLTTVAEDQLGVLEATPSGGLYDVIDYQLEVVSGGGCLVEFFVSRPIEAPTLAVTDITTIDENSPTVLDFTPSGGLYDSIEYAIEVISGNGCLALTNP